MGKQLLDLSSSQILVESQAVPKLYIAQDRDKDLHARSSVLVLKLTQQLKLKDSAQSADMFHFAVLEVVCQRHQTP
jgi:hypothetical protein